MQIAPTITFRGIRHSTILEQDIDAHLRKLEIYYPRITGCRVAVELVHRHHEKGNRFHVRIDLTVPREEIVVSHEGGLHATAQDVQAEKLAKVAELDPERKHARVAIREAFEIVRRQLQDFARRQRGAVKSAVRQSRGRVATLSPVDKYGYIEAGDGRGIYFQKSSVLENAFDRLKLGSAVSFVEEQGEKGPQASTVKLLHPRRVHHASQRSAGARLVR